MLQPKKFFVALLALASLLAGFAIAAPAQAAGSEPLLLVAARRLHDPIYRQTVIVAKPLENGAYLGFILNKPTRLSLGDLFPTDAPSKRVRDRVYLGGPQSVNVVVALVAGHLNPANGFMQLAPYMYLALTARTVDEVIASAADRARYFVGVVLWRPGELDDELKQHAWHVANFEPEVALRKDTAGLWAELVQRAEGKEKSIVVEAPFGERQVAALYAGGYAR